MRRRAFFALTLATSLAACARADDAPWSLRSALDAARAHSPDTALAAARLERARALARQADAAVQPQVTLRAGYTQSDNPMMAFGAILNQGAFQAEESPDRP